MTDEEIYQIIEDNKEETEAFYQKVHTQVEASIVKYAEVKKKRRKNMRVIFSTATAFILVVCLAVVLPIVLQTEDEPLTPIRYYDDLTLEKEDLDITLLSYFQNKGKEILFLDWYDTAEECITTRYFDKNNVETTVYLKEFLVHEDGYFVELYVMERDIVVNRFESEWDESTEININGIVVTYGTQEMKEVARAKFEYNGYKYYLELQDSTDEEFLLSAIASMIPSQQTQAVA